MKVETYEAISLDEQNGTVINEEVSEEALALIESLDLQGQRQLIAERTVDAEEGVSVATRNPYRLMTAEESAIYSALMPKHVDLADYSDGSIPLRALQVAAHAKSLRVFDRIEVWCPKDPRQPDPVLVGWIGNRYSSDRKCFILARWGEVLESLDDLREKALPIVRARVAAKIAKAKAAVSQFESTLDENILSYLHGGDDESFYVAGSLADTSF